MGRIKKRLARKKRSIKKVVRHVQKSESKTTEQQSKENEMIKTMLMRQQPALAGQTQQTDKLQQQLDTFNKTYNDKLKELQNMKERAREKQDLIQNLAAEKRQVKEDIRHQQDLNKMAEDHNNEMEKQEQRLKKEQDKGKELQKKAEEFDKDSEETVFRNQMIKIEDQINELNHRIAQNRNEIEKNLMYSELKEKKRELRDIRANAKALKAIVNSDEYKNVEQELK